MESEYPMNIAVVYYSLTGNNAKLAQSVSKALDISCVAIRPEKPVSNGTILLNLLFGGAPKSQPEPSSLSDYDRVLFVAPVWMGMAAFPLRPFLSAVGKWKKSFAFLTIDGGSEGSNSGLEKDLVKRAGFAPAFFLPQHISVLLSAKSAPAPDASKPYLITEEDGDTLAKIAVDAMNKSGFLTD